MTSRGEQSNNDEHQVNSSFIVMANIVVLFEFQDGPEMFIYKEHFLIHNRKPSIIQRKRSQRDKPLRRKESSEDRDKDCEGKPVDDQLDQFAGSCIEESLEKWCSIKEEAGR